MKREEEEEQKKRKPARGDGRQKIDNNVETCEGKHGRKCESAERNQLAAEGEMAGDPRGEKMRRRGGKE